MRAAVISELGRLPEIGEVPDPVRAEGEALIRIEAVPLNPIDINVCAGRFYGGSPPLPFVPGCEGVGRVVEGETLAPGTLVWAHGAGMGTTARRGARRSPVGARGRAGAAAGRLRSGARGSARDRRAGGLASRSPCGHPCRRARRCWCSAPPERSGSWRCRGADPGRGPRGRRGPAPEALERARRLGADAVVSLDEETTWRSVRGRLAAARGRRSSSIRCGASRWWPRRRRPRQDARIVHIGQSAGPEAPLLSADVRGQAAEHPRLHELRACRAT